jgi:hypothetical protein
VHTHGGIALLTATEKRNTGVFKLWKTQYRFHKRKALPQKIASKAFFDTVDGAVN